MAGEGCGAQGLGFGFFILRGENQSGRSQERGSSGRWGRVRERVSNAMKSLGQRGGGDPERGGASAEQKGPCQPGDRWPGGGARWGRRLGDQEARALPRGCDIL